VPVVELSDEDANLLAVAKKAGGMQGLDTLTRAYNLHQSLYTDPKLRPHYEAVIEAKHPNAATTRKIAEPYVAEARAVGKKLDDYIAAQEKAKAEAEEAKGQSDFAAEWERVKKAYDLTEEGEKALFEHMKSRKIYDAEAGALSYFKHNPKPAEPITPTSISPSGWNLTTPTQGDTEDSFKLLHENPERWAEMEAANAINQIRREQGV
jgi:hypothetical protein